MGNKWGFHSGVMHSKDAKISGDLYVQDDIVFSDVSAGVLGVTGGIDMQSTTSAIGIDMGGTFTTSAINIDGTCTHRALMIGTKDSGLTISTTGHTLDEEPANNYLFGLFSKVAATEATSADELRSAWIRTRVNVNCDIGSNAGWGYGICGAEIQLKFYGGTTKVYAWQNSAVWAQLESQAATTTFKSGSYSQCLLANIGLTSATLESGAVIAGVTVNSNTATLTNTGDAYYGLFITDKTGTNTDFSSGIYIASSVATTGVTIGACTTGIYLSGTCTTGIAIGLTGSALSLAAAASRYLSIWTTSSITSGTARTAEITQRHGAAGASTNSQTMYVELETNYKLGNSITAFYAVTDLQTNGGCSGLMTVVCAEMDMAGSTTPYGTPAIYDAEINCPTSYTTDGDITVFRVGAWGATVAEFDSHGQLFSIQGVTPAAGKFISLTSQTAKIEIGTTDRYLLLSQIEDGLGLGTSASDMVLTAAANRAVSIWTTSSITSGTARAAELYHTMTAAGSADAQAMYVGLETNYKLGNSLTALYAVTDLKTNGGASGLITVVCAEIDMAASTTPYGTPAVYDAEINCPTSYTTDGDITVFRVGAWGATVAEFDSHGQLFSIQGVTPAAGKFISLTSQTAKVEIGTTNRYMVLSQLEDGLGLGTSASDMVLTAAANRAVSIWTTSGLTSGTARAFELYHTMTAAGSADTQAAYIGMETNYKLGNSITSLYVKTDLLTNGGSAGLTSALCAELMLANMANVWGTNAVIDIEIGYGASTTNATVSAIRLGAWGTNVSEFDDHGYLFDISGVTKNNGKFFQDNTANAATQALKCRINGTEYFIMLTSVST